jgi:hypothetical protein
LPTRTPSDPEELLGEPLLPSFRRKRKREAKTLLSLRNIKKL